MKSKKPVIPLQSKYTRDVIKLQTAQQTSSNMTTEQENMVYDQRLRGLSLLSLEKQRLQSSTTYVGGKKSYRANEAVLHRCAQQQDMGQWPKAAGREILIGSKKSIPDAEKKFCTVTGNAEKLWNLHLCSNLRTP